MVRKTRIVFPKFFFVLIVFGAIWGAYRFYPREQASIFAITEPELTYGDTSLVGEIYKDSSLENEGNYYLSTPEGRVIMLDSVGIDELVGLTVQATGYLTPAESELSLPLMTVYSLETSY